MNYPNNQTESNGSEYPTQEQRMNMKEFCNNYIYQFIQIETNDGSMHIGILHSFDDEKLYILMPSTEDNQHNRFEGNDERLFPFFGPFGLFAFPFYGVRRFGPYRPYWW
ncbi:MULTISPECIES: hypothetical protein [Virgibacillus]|uniref:Uncharacterized protein n=1 Tax=Virgibacillus massiliensis TaxID=1462526 RepID=A0A024Q6E4_9BACI|nr:MULTISPECIES: hypothetical protein [Virgibacillus]EQB38455.1 hypothetical protein M948_07685 [Virgibacillus sp. CM-4]MYL41161.1 hypothetical protein [Virgibacillus massiliensis]CDQ38034.1 hypothetical protein BN990_00301 [Virgibacillus massiliensis]